MASKRLDVGVIAIGVSSREESGRRDPSEEESLKPPFNYRRLSPRDKCPQSYHNQCLTKR